MYKYELKLCLLVILVVCSSLVMAIDQDDTTNDGVKNVQGIFQTLGDVQVATVTLVVSNSLNVHGISAIDVYPGANCTSAALTTTKGTPGVWITTLGLFKGGSMAVGGNVLYSAVRNTMALAGGAATPQNFVQSVKLGTFTGASTVSLPNAPLCTSGCGGSDQVIPTGNFRVIYTSNTLQKPDECINMTCTDSTKTCTPTQTNLYE